MDKRTDIYGLGAILFEILTGQAPHQLDDSDSENSRLAAMLLRIATSDTPRVQAIDEAISDELDHICTIAMARHRDERYQSAKDLKAALLQFQVHEESIELAMRATAVLSVARTSGTYDDCIEIFPPTAVISLPPPKRPSSDGTISWNLTLAPSAAGSRISVHVHCSESRGTRRLENVTRGNADISP
jgi:serine/threonine protein kinase